MMSQEGVNRPAKKYKILDFSRETVNFYLTFVGTLIIQRRRRPVRLPGDRPPKHQNRYKP